VISELFRNGSFREELLLLGSSFSSLLLETDKPGGGTTSLSSEGLWADDNAWSGDNSVG
jgi:hypothetical protein